MSSRLPRRHRTVAALPFGDEILWARSRQVQLRQILAGGLIDVPWYSLQAGQSFAGPRAAAGDYVDRGRKRGLSPNPLFEPEWYAPQGWNIGGIDPVVRYLRGGWRTTSAHPGFDSHRWVAEHPAGATHPGGPLGHFYSVASERTLVPAMAGGAEPWGALRRRLEVAAERVATQQELRRPRLQDAYDLEREKDFRARWAEAVIPSFAAGPAVTVVMPVRNRPSQILAAIASVQHQSLPDWELVVVDDGSTDRTAEVVAHLAARDSRIRLLGTTGLGAAAARNVGLDAARGHYVAFLDSDNTWTPNFLQLSLAAMHGMGLRAAYSIVAFRADERTRYLAYEGDLEHLVVNNHIDLNALVAERTLLQAVGGFDPWLRRMIDWDLALRVSEQYPPQLLPFLGVLYFDEESLSSRISTTESARWAEVVQSRHLVDWSIAAAAPRVLARTSVVIDTFQDWTGALATARSVIEHRAGDVEVLVLDDGSLPATSMILETAVGTVPGVRVERLPRRGGRSLAGNLSFLRASGEVVVWLRPGCQVTSGWLEPVREALANPAVQVATSVVVDDSGLVVEAGQVRTPGAIPHAFLAGHPVDDARRRPQLAVDAVGQHVFATRASDFVRVGGFDCLFGADLSATDLSLRMGEDKPGSVVVATGSAILAPPRASADLPTDESEPTGSDRMEVDRFLELWGNAGSATAERAWHDAGFHLAHVVAPTTSPIERLAPVVVLDRGSAPGGRWVVRVAGPEGESLRGWAVALSAQLCEGGLLCVVVGPESDRRPSRYLDTVVVHVGSQGRVHPGRLDVLVGEGPGPEDAARFDLVRTLAATSTGDPSDKDAVVEVLPRDPAAAADHLVSAVRELGARRV